MKKVSFPVVQRQNLIACGSRVPLVHSTGSKILNKSANFERVAEILSFAFAQIHMHLSEFYNHKATIIYVIYPCILTRNKSVNSSVENTFPESLYLQTGLYTCKLQV